MHAGAAILAGLSVVSTVNSVRAQEVGLFKLNKDCSFVGIDSETPAPTKEDIGMAMVLVDFTTIEDQPQPFSQLWLYSCEGREVIRASWTEAGRATSVASQLRASSGDFASWVSMIKKTSAEQVEQASGFNDMGQGKCACALLYGIQVNE